MTLRRRTVEHVFGTLKHWVGSTHFVTMTLAHGSTEMSLHVLVAHRHARPHPSAQRGRMWPRSLTTSLACSR